MIPELRPSNPNTSGPVQVGVAKLKGVHNAMAKNRVEEQDPEGK